MSFELDANDEQLLLSGVKQAVSLVDSQGLSPNDAMYKVATELHYGPGYLRAACHAFNTGRQLAQWQANDSTLDKLASFPLADYDAIAARIWTTAPAEKAASAPPLSVPLRGYDYAYQQELLHKPLQSLVKSARAEVPRESQEVTQAWSSYERSKKAVETARQEKSAVEYNLHRVMHGLTQYFRKSAYDRLPLAQVEYAVSAMHGEPGTALIDYLASGLPAEKRANDHLMSWRGFSQAVDHTAAPYPQVAEALRLGQQVLQCREHLKQAMSSMTEAQERWSALCLPKQAAVAPDDSQATYFLIPEPKEQPAVKQANIFQRTYEGIADRSREYRDKQVADQLLELESPDHINELRKIRAQTALTSMLSDPDNPLHEHDPESVLAQYNQLVQLSPSIADQSAALQPLLQKRLGGHTEPFEISEVAKLENAMQQGSLGGAVQAKPVSGIGRPGAKTPGADT